MSDELLQAVKSAIAKLEADGDEHGVAADLRAAIPAQSAGPADMAIYDSIARRALSPQPAAPLQPEGRWVPLEPTREMLNAAIDVDSYKLGDISPLGFRCSPQQLFEKCYAAMLAAAPSHLAACAGGGVTQPLTEQDIRSIWQTIDTGDIEDDLMAFAQAIIVAQAIIAASAADALLKTLSGIANANQREWDEAYRHPAHFKEWAQSRARHAIAAHGIVEPAPRPDAATGQMKKEGGA